MPRLIDADLLIESMGLENAVKWGNKDGYQQDHSYGTLMRYEIKDEIDAQPTVESVSLDKLCEWLAKNDYEIFCYLCHDAFDADGGCPNQVYEKQWLCGSKGHWKAFLTKVMEGWKDEAGS